jgi:hypothetical protein
MSLAGRGYDADWIRALVNQQAAWANIPPKRQSNAAHVLWPLPGQPHASSFWGAVDLDLPGIDGEPETL